jgi:WS/DGAT/MGAT family acyltransferase
MMALSQQLFDASPDALPEKEKPAPAHPEAGLLDRLIGPALVEVVRHPERLVEAVELAASGAGMLLEELRKPKDPRSPLKGEFGLRKRVAWSEPVSIADVKEIGRRCEATVNDVLVAGMTGALRSYLKKRGVDVRRTRLHAMVPVDLRSRDRALELGNDFGLVILELAIGIASPLGRVRVTRARMEALKRSPEAVAIRTLFSLFGRGPKVLEDVAVDLFGSRASLVLTNVAGPRQKLFLAGVPIDRMMFWVPHPGRQLGMGISILSYRGEASLAVIADAHLVPDPEAITQQFNREFARMRRAVLAGVAATAQAQARAVPPRKAARRARMARARRSA